MKRKAILLTLPYILLGKSIDFDTALQLALENNKELQAKKLSINRAKERLNEAKSYDRGVLKLSEEFYRTNNSMYVFGSKLTSREATFNDFGFNEFLNGLGGAMMTSSGEMGDFNNFASNLSNPSTQQELLSTQPDNLNYPDARNNFETSITYEIPIFVGFKIENAKKMANLQIKANEVKHSFDKDLLGLEVLKAYNGAVASKFFIKATNKAKEATSSYVDFASALYSEGLVTDIDVKQAKAYDANINAKSIEANNNYNLSLAYLRFLIDKQDIDDVSGFKSVTINSSSLEELQDNALSNRNDLKWMDYNVDTMDKKIDMDSSDFYPTVGMQLKYGYNDNSLTLDGDKDSYLIAIGASYKLFDGGTRDAVREQAKIDFNETKLYSDYMKSGIKLEVEKNFFSYQALKAQLREKTIEATLADEVLEQSTEMYKNSLLNMTELLMQEAKAEKSRAELIKARYDVAQAGAKLQISIGNSLESK